MVIFCATVSYIFEMQGGAPFVLTGRINAGLPNIEPPAFSRAFGNQTESFIDMTKNLKSGVLIIPLVSIIGNVAIAKAFCMILTTYYLKFYQFLFKSNRIFFRRISFII